jgi:hypothetical protein
MLMRERDYEILFYSIHEQYCERASSAPDEQIAVAPSRGNDEGNT